MNPEDDKNQQLRVLEALLFAATEPMTTKDIHTRMSDSADLGALLPKLQEHYKDRGVHLVEMDGSWAFRTAPDLAEMLQIEEQVSRKLSRAAMETLSIIAYHQPVTRAEIENIRGVATNKGTLDVLMEASWIKPGRRRETPGRPLTWVTTTAFLDQFGLESMMDLPGLDDLKASGMLDRRPALETLPGTGDLFEAEDEELEDDAYGDEAEADDDINADQDIEEPEAETEEQDTQQAV